MSDKTKILAVAPSKTIIIKPDEACSVSIDSEVARIDPKSFQFAQLQPGVTYEFATGAGVVTLSYLAKDEARQDAFVMDKIRQVTETAIKPPPAIVVAVKSSQPEGRSDGKAINR